MDDVRINKLFGFGVKIYPYSLVWKKGVTYEDWCVWDRLREVS